jgi:sugar/nucleoside kinase (ribokinase family)
MTTPADIQVAIVGSIGLDDIETPFAKHKRLLGGSVSYACATASFFARTGMVGIVGDDFSEEYMDVYRGFGIDLQGLQAVPGNTFAWSGVYDADMINRETLSTELGVFETFKPELPESYRNAPFLLLGNISPELQLHVLAEAKGAQFVMADTMDLWINIARDPLMELIGKVDLLTVNDSEARLLTGKYHLRQCAETILGWGPEYLIIKKGEHGATLFSKAGIFLLPAYPIEAVVDPTGAGDSFAGAFLGHLAEGGTVDDHAVRASMLYGSIVASCGVEAFSLDALTGLTRDGIEARMAEYRNMLKVS